MNIHLFYLIHNEKPYKRYYGQQLNRKFPGGMIHEAREFIDRYSKAFRITFDTHYNKQLFDGERKSKWRILIENLTWCIKYKEVCNYYYLYGLDLKNRSPQDYMAYTEFRVMRNILNIRQRENLPTKYTFNYLALTRDKFVFGQYAKSLGFPVPKTICIFRDGKVCYLDCDEDNSVHFEPFESIGTKEFDVFCKEISGEGGKGAFPLKICNGHFFVGNEEISLDSLRQRIGNDFYLVQEKVYNHKLISKIYPNSVNTLRITTVLKDGIVHLYDARLRTGANGSLVDNACFGGVVIGINPDGSLTDWGIREPGKSDVLIVHRKHPDTGFEFAGLKIPYYDEAVKMVKQLHTFYYGIPSMGWDMAITETGPVLLESGEDWEMPNGQIFFGGRRRDFYNLHGDALKIKLRKY